MHEYVINLHMHTTYSDGCGTHEEIAQAAIRAGLDAVIVTDHNIWVQGPEGYYGEDDQRVLMLIGEEVHDPWRRPQKNHLLVFGAERELAPLAENPQRLIDSANEADGLTFIAHPVDPPAPRFGQKDLSWVDWDVHGFTGIELWNAMTDFKSQLQPVWRAVYIAYHPPAVMRKPFDETLKKWDELLKKGRRVVAIGSSDAHADTGRLGPLQKVVFPYEFLFQTVNTHIFTSEPLSGEFDQDRQLVLDALRQGHAFVGYDLPASTRGFRFKAQGLGKTAWMGDEIGAKNGVTLQVRLPQRAAYRLLKDGEVVKAEEHSDACTYITTEPGVYRVECYIPYQGQRRGWIFSNPIYVR